MKTFIFFILSIFCFNLSFSQCTTADAGPDVLICPEGGSAQIGTTSLQRGGFSWTPTLGLNNPTISTPTATPVVTTTYTLRKSGTNLIANGDFEQGNTLFTNGYLFAVTAGAGRYFIGPDPHTFHGPWCTTPDHSAVGTNMMYVDGSNSANVPFWSQIIPSVAASTNTFSVWLLSTNNFSQNSTSTEIPIVQLRVNGVNVGAPFRVLTCQWTNMVVPVNFAIPGTNVLLELIDLTVGPGNNDFAVDDIFMGCSSTDQVTVSVCVDPAITPASYFEVQNCSPAVPNSPIVPNTSNSYCYFWECGAKAHFFSNISTNNQWYVNDILLPNPIGTYNPAVGSVYYASPQELVISLAAGSPQSFKVQLKNTTYGNTQLTTPTYVYFGAHIASGELIGPYKPNIALMGYSTPFDNRTGPNATYVWNISYPGVTIFDIIPTDPYFAASFPTYPSGPPPAFVNGTLTITNSYCNGVYPIKFYYNPNLKMANIEHPAIEVYPNPTTTSITIQSNNGTISAINLVDMSGFIVKQSKFRNVKRATLNVSDLKIGLYNCRIYTDLGVENQKILIKR